MYAACIAGFLALRAVSPDLSPFLSLVNSFTPFLFVAAPVFVLLALWTRSRLALISAAIPPTLFLVLYGVLFLPHTGLPTRPALRVMTFNLGLHLSQPEALLEIIEAQEADLVAVQEITPEMADLMQRELGSTYPYAVVAPERATTGLFSRYPIVEQEWIEPDGGRTYIRAVVEWEGVPLTVYVVHPLPPGLEWYQGLAVPVGLHEDRPQRQIEGVVSRAVDEEGPVLIVGDFNLSDQAQGYRMVAREFEDAYREAGRGFGFTFPRGMRLGGVRVPGPLIRIDYIFHSSDLRAHQAYVGCGGGSDHCYVVAELSRGERSRP